jgi:hypothetical protein
VSSLPQLGTSQRSYGITFPIRGVAHGSLPSNDLFSDAPLIFEKVEDPKTAWVVQENQELYKIKPGLKNFGIPTLRSIHNF